MPVNVEIKARTERTQFIREILTSRHAEYRGTDNQTDTYFHCAQGRLKLRQGNVEKNLIFYRRPDQAGPKTAEVSLYKPDNSGDLKQLLSQALGVWKQVVKQREIYFIDNVKFHLDHVEGLGNFVEIEAIDTDGSIPVDKLREQCNFYLNLFEIQAEDLLDRSYSDMVTENSG